MIKLDPDSQVKKLAPEVAAMLARRFNPGANAGGDGGGRGAGRGGPGGPGGARGPGGPGGRGGDPGQIFERAPAVTLAGLKQGDAIVVLTTAGSDPGRVTAVMLVAGVEPLLTLADRHPRHYERLEPRRRWRRRRLERNCGETVEWNETRINEQRKYVEFATIVFLASSVALLLTSALAQQNTGTVKGTLTDDSGAVIPAANVTLAAWRHEKSADAGRRQLYLRGCGPGQLHRQREFSGL